MGIAPGVDGDISDGRSLLVDKPASRIHIGSANVRNDDSRVRETDRHGAIKLQYEPTEPPQNAI
jgi:hypothetical protein